MRKLGLALAVLALVAIPAIAQDMNIIGAGARAHGMGGAFIAIADDATALSWNPAGIAQLDKPEASAVGLFNMKKITDDFTASGSWSTSVSEESNPKHIAPNFFSLALPFKMQDRNVVMAVAYNRMVDFGDELDSSHQYTGLYDYTMDYKEKFAGGIDAITPAIAIQVTPKFLIGAAGNIILNGATLTREYEYTGDVAGTESSEEEMKFSGFNINTGLLFFASKQLNIGASLRLPFTLTRTGSYHSEYNYNLLTTNYSGSYDTTYPDEQRKWTMPLMIGIGLAYKPTENLTLAFDYERRNYGGTDFTAKEDTGTGVFSEEFENVWMNVNQFRVGMEYLFIGQNAVFPLRLGFRTNPQTYPVTEWTEDASYDWTSDSTVAIPMVFTGGFGMKFGRVWLDLAYEMETGTTEKETWNWNDGDIWKWETKVLSHNILASCIVHF